jgi:uncharacterized protein (UPF0335 family)
MNDKSYEDALNVAIKELSGLMEECEILETRRAQLNQRIARLRKGVAGLSSLAGREWPDVINQHPNLFPDSMPLDIGMTDAVRKVLQSNDIFFTPVDVRTDLRSFGYDTEQYKNILASIHTILKRLAAAGEVQTGTVEDGTVYKWKRGVRVIRQGTALGQQPAFDQSKLPTIGEPSAHTTKKKSHLRRGGE